MRNNNLGLAYFYAKNLYEIDAIQREISRTEEDIEVLASKEEVSDLKRKLEALESDFDFLKTKNFAIKEAAKS